jgi:uncharacterized membrane protein
LPDVSGAAPSGRTRRAGGAGYAGDNEDDAAADNRRGEEAWPFMKFERITQTFFRGLLAILPIAATIFVLVWLAGFFESALGPLIRVLLPSGENGSHYYVHGMGLVVGLLLVFVIGLVLNAWIVQQFLSASEHLLQRIPVANTVMSSVRDLIGFFSQSQRKQMSQVVVVRLGDLRLLGFVTRDDLSDMPAAAGGRDSVAVYFQLSYALGGFTLIVPRTSIEPVDMSMEQAMRFMITAGMKAAGGELDQELGPDEPAPPTGGHELDPQSKGGGSGTMSAPHAGLSHPAARLEPQL